ncbi:unnamed protein product, partial [Medioppia subpectinata]
LVPVLACQDRLLRIIKDSSCQYEIEISGIPNALLWMHYSANGVTETLVCYGTLDGKVALVSIDFSKKPLEPLHKWEIPDKGSKPSVTCISIADSAAELYVGRSDGNVEIWSFAETLNENGEEMIDLSLAPILRDQHNCGESLTSLLVCNYGNLILGSTFTGVIFGLTRNEMINQKLNPNYLLISKDMAMKIEGLRDECERLEQKLAQERERYQEMTTKGGSDDLETSDKTYNTKYKLPTFNWVPLKPNQVKGTIFNEFHNEDKILKAVNFDHFEEQFKLGTKPELMRKNSVSTLNASKRFKLPEKVSLLEHNRLRNMAISMRKIDIDTDSVVRAINSFDTNCLTAEYLEVLLRMIPNADEAKAYREYERSGRLLDEMNEVDKFLFHISKIERLEQKLKIMFYMTSLVQPNQSREESIVSQCRSRIAVITEAARLLRKSQGIRMILEHVLVFGNYLNCSTRTIATAPAYGFKLTTLDLISETKSSVDRSRSLLHYISDHILNSAENGPKPIRVNPFVTLGKNSGHMSGTDTLENIKMPFDLEKLLTAVERATVVSMETCVLEVIDLEKGMELCKQELQLRNSSGLANNQATQHLRQFISNKSPELQALREDLKRAQHEYNECVEYFGESTKLMESSNQLFGTFTRFLKNFKQCQSDNITAQRKKFEEELRQQILEKQQKSPEKEASNEVKVREKRLLKQDEVYNGALEDILLGLKNEPYRRADAVRRSQRRKQENIRLSSTELMEM